MGFLFGKTAMGTYVVVAFWVACYYFFSGMFPMMNARGIHLWDDRSKDGKKEGRLDK